MKTYFLADPPKWAPAVFDWVKSRPEEVRYDMAADGNLDLESDMALAGLRIEWICRPVACGRQPFPKAVD